MISQKEIHQVAVDHLFWEYPVSIPEKLCLIHSEVSEALEADRTLGSKKNLGEELADIIIRTLDLAQFLGYNMDEEVSRKHEINKSRPIRHGKRY
jgi:NTP pyrophosphatase (non-canonical NTP hydrolase)